MRYTTDPPTPTPHRRTSNRGVAPDFYFPNTPIARRTSSVGSQASHRSMASRAASQVHQVCAPNCPMTVRQGFA